MCERIWTLPGDRREAIFLTDEDRELFLETLGQACERTGWRVHSYVLSLPRKSRQCRVLAGREKGYDNKHPRSENAALF